MTTSNPPTFGTGKICYVEIPATDIRRSADFYVRAFGWKTRQRGDGAIVQPIQLDEREVVARFRDPGGNVLSIYQQPGLAAIEAAQH